ncbi:MAG: hypothetical protein H3C35_07665 [Bacteroidetes bacterium]|nr:hypothetical protein [Bacteroidota bacterium]
MRSDEEVLMKGLQIQHRIIDLNAMMNSGQGKNQLTLSFDMYCSLMDYILLINHSSQERDKILEELILRDDLLFDTGTMQLKILVDFFLPAESILIT